jgi:hypothetical protein
MTFPGNMSSTRRFRYEKNDISALRKNIYDLELDDSPEVNVSPEIIDRCINPALRCACLHWITHWLAGEIQLDGDGYVYDFLLELFEHWLEAMSFLR